MDKKNFEIIENDKGQTKDDFYAEFKEKLEESHKFPCTYLFKYIIPAEESKIAQLHTIFDKSDASFSTRDSKNGKYTSVTIKVRVSDAHDVIIYYRQASAIEGIMML